MSNPIFVTDPAGNNNPYLEIIPSGFLLGGIDGSNNALVDYAVGSNWSNLVTVVAGGTHFLPVLGLAFGASVWIALVNTVSGGGSVNGTAFYKSTDKGKTWSNPFTATTSDPPDQVVFANSTFVAINTSGQNPALQGLGGTVWTSSDGTTWSSAASPIAAPLSCSSLSVANNLFFLGASNLSTGSASFFRSANASTWTQSGTAFGSLQGQSGGPAVSSVTPGNVAFGNSTYVSAAQYDSNGYNWLTMSSSADGLTWGNGQQFGNFTILNPHVVSGQGPVTEYNPTFVNYNITFSNGVFVVPVAITTSNLNTTVTVPTGQEPIEFIETQYFLDYSQNDIGVMVSSNGTSWTFQKILSGPITGIPGNTYVTVGPGSTQVNIIGHNAISLETGHLVGFSSVANRFLAVLNTVLNYRITNYQTFPAGAPTFTFTGNNTQIFSTSTNGTNWQTAVTFSAVGISSTTTPDIKCVGAGPVASS